jgi:hypothetical protein
MGMLEPLLHVCPSRGAPWEASVYECPDLLIESAYAGCSSRINRSQSRSLPAGLYCQKAHFYELHSEHTNGVVAPERGVR